MMSDVKKKKRSRLLSNRVSRNSKKCRFLVVALNEWDELRKDAIQLLFHAFTGLISTCVFDE